MIKKIINIIKFFFVYCFIVKCYYFIFLGFYFIKEDLRYGLNDYYLYFVLFVSSIYFRYLMSLFVTFETVPLYHDTIYFYSIFCEIKNKGFLNFCVKVYWNFKIKVINIGKKYWAFRLKLSPLNLKVNYRIYTIYDKYFKEKDKMKKQQEEKRREEFRKKKAQALNIPLREHVKTRINLKDFYGVSRKKKVYKDKKTKDTDDSLPRKPRLSRITKPKDFFARYIVWLDKKKNNTFLKMLLNLVMSFFCLIDLIILSFTCLLNSKLNLTWKPLNIRLPYLKKNKKIIKKTNKKINKK